MIEQIKRLIAFLILLAVITGISDAVSEERLVFILCNPKTPVNVRIRPKKGTDIVGRLDFGDSITTDGKTRNGFLHVMGIGEAGEGWIREGYAVDDQPEELERARANVAASGRVMSYRRIGGSKNGWVNVGTDVRVLAVSEEWAVTSRGYIRTKYLEVWYE